MHWPYSQLVIRWYTVTTRDLPVYVSHQDVPCTGRRERNDVRPPVSHVVVYIPCSKRLSIVVYSYAFFFQGFTAVQKRQQCELVLVMIFYQVVSQEHVLVCITRKETRPVIYMPFFKHHFHFPAHVVGGFTLPVIFWTSHGHRCLPFAPPVRAFIFIAHRFSIHTARRFSSNAANSRSRAFP